jgi:hypothetical protein
MISARCGARVTIEENNLYCLRSPYIVILSPQNSDISSQVYLAPALRVKLIADRQNLPSLEPS